MCAVSVRIHVAKRGSGRGRGRPPHSTHRIVLVVRVLDTHDVQEVLDGREVVGTDRSARAGVERVHVVRRSEEVVEVLSGVVGGGPALLCSSSKGRDGGRSGRLFGAGRVPFVISTAASDRQAQARGMRTRNVRYTAPFSAFLPLR